MIDILITKTGTQLKDFLAALVSPVQYNTDLLKIVETEQTKHAKWNGRKMVLQAALNDLFGVIAVPYIIIETNNSVVSGLYFSEESELAPVYFSESSELDPIYFIESSEIPASTEDFTIKIPSGIYTTELERRIKAQTNIYKLAGKTFDIITY